MHYRQVKLYDICPVLTFLDIAIPKESIKCILYIYTYIQKQKQTKIYYSIITFYLAYRQYFILIHLSFNIWVYFCILIKYWNEHSTYICMCVCIRWFSGYKCLCLIYIFKALGYEQILDSSVFVLEMLRRLLLALHSKVIHDCVWEAYITCLRLSPGQENAE